MNQPRPVVKLVGADGNAFAIIGRCSAVMKKAGVSPKRIKEFQDEATSSDYDNVLWTAMKYCEVE